MNDRVHNRVTRPPPPHRRAAAKNRACRKLIIVSLAGCRGYSISRFDDQNREGEIKFCLFVYQLLFVDYRKVRFFFRYIYRVHVKL